MSKKNIGKNTNFPATKFNFNLNRSSVVLGSPSNAFLQLVLISWVVVLSSCLIWQIISFILPRILKAGKEPSPPYVRYRVKMWNKLASSSKNQCLKSEKQCVHPRILLLWQKVCVKRHQHQFIVALNIWAFRRQHRDEFCIKTWVYVIQRPIGSGPMCACDWLREDADFGKTKITFSGETHFGLGEYVNPHAYIEKPTHPKRVSVWWGSWSRGIIGLFFFKNEQGVAVTVNSKGYWVMLNEFLFTKIE